MRVRYDSSGGVSMLSHNSEYEKAAGPPQLKETAGDATPQATSSGRDYSLFISRIEMEKDICEVRFCPTLYNHSGHYS